MTLLSFALVVVCGFGVGMLSGMFGIGGGGMVVPLLNVAFGLPVLNATATSLLTIALTGISGSFKHLRQKTARLKTGLTIGGFGALASVVSSLCAGTMPDLAMVLLTIAVILFSVGMMLWTLLCGRMSPSGSERLLQPTQTKDFLATLAIALIGGAIAGLVGVGGGFIIVPFCVSYLGFSLKEAAGTSLIAITVIAIPGIIVHALLGHIAWFYGLAVIVGTIPGAQLGAWLIARLPERQMRFAFCGVLTLMGLLMLSKQLLH
ncbi:MAG: sulfite exporter TauE/SafE family protein [Coriobacteriales bacterium]|jgi:uncharacterized membrane protein YfcA|nr:sulfite exporter TauE/SafE family protein [Coriobacteriales bacterium]